MERASFRLVDYHFDKIVLDLENLKPCFSTTSFVALCDESLSIMILLFILFKTIVSSNQ